jgi:hypothetical protein
VGALEVPLRSHLPIFYDTDANRLRVSAAFLRAGLRSGQRCFLVAGDEVRDVYLAALSGTLEEVGSAHLGGSLTTVSSLGQSAAEALATWDRILGEAAADGPGPMRVVGELASYRPPFSSREELGLYEDRLGQLMRRFPVTVLCQYDARRVDGNTILAALKAHPDIFDHHLGGFLA